MREPKAGDRCEHARLTSVETMRMERCDVRHMQGKPPGCLYPCKKGAKTVLLCQLHAPKLSEAMRKRQRPKKVNAEQIDLVASALYSCEGHEERLNPGPLTKAGIADPLASLPRGERFTLEMPEGI